MHRGIDGMFAFSSGLCSWINKDSRICSRRPLLSLPMTSGLWKSTRWSGLACKCLHTAELSDVRCSSIRFIKLRCVCPMYEAPHEQVYFTHFWLIKSFQYSNYIKSDVSDKTLHLPQNLFVCGKHLFCWLFAILLSIVSTTTQPDTTGNTLCFGIIK